MVLARPVDMPVAATREPPVGRGGGAVYPSAAALGGGGVCWQPVWASLVAQPAKSLPAMRETPSRFLGQEDPPEKG